MSTPDQTPRSSGRFAHERWWREIAADDRLTEFASAHESHHKQLADSTSFGLLARLMRGVGEATGDAHYIQLAHELTQAAKPAQESFACWAPVMALRWTPQELAVAYPGYVRHWRSMQRIVEAVASPYLRFHAAHAVARACMQAPVDETALAVGLSLLKASDLSRRDRPDHRFVQLRQSPPQWPNIALLLEERFAGDRRWRDLVDPDELAVEMFGAELRDLWENINATVYDEVASQLLRAGCRTVPHDGQLAVNARLIAAAERLVGSGRLTIARRGRVAADESPRLVIANIESEDFSVGAPLAARLLDLATPPEAMVADIEHPHLFLTIRRHDALLANYALASDPASSVGAYLRRSVRDADGTSSVELLAIEGPERLEHVTVPVFSVVPLSLLTRETRERWGNQVSVGQGAALVDVALGPLLELWLSQPGSRFRYAFIRTEPAGRVLPLLVGVAEVAGAAATHLLLKPLSPPAVRKMKAAFEELDPEGAQLVVDPALLNDFEPLAQVALAHLALEEVRFAQAAYGSVRSASSLGESGCRFVSASRPCR